MIYTLFDSLAESQGFPLARNNYHNLTRVQYSAHANRERHPRNLADISFKEPRVRENCVVGQRLDTRARGERGAWFVERNVAILPYTAEEELDSAVGLDLVLILLTFSYQILLVAVKDVDLARWYVDCGRNKPLSRGVWHGK